MPRKKQAAPEQAVPAPAGDERAGAQGARPKTSPLAELLPSAVTVHAPLTLIEVAEAADLDALLGDTRVAPLVVARLSPTVAVALPDKARALLDALRKAGHTPKVSGE